MINIHSRLSALELTCLTIARERRAAPRKFLMFVMLLTVNPAYKLVQP